MRRVVSAALVATSVALMACGSALAAETGATMFAQNCSACHQLTGKGIPGAFPALAGSKLVQGSAPPLAILVLNGRGGMPTFKAELTDEQIADILSYVRTSWGNKAPVLTAAAVAKVRSGGAASSPGKTGATQAH